MKTTSILTILFIGNILFMHSSCLPKTRLLNNKTILTDTTKHKKIAKERVQNKGLYSHLPFAPKLR